MRIAYLTTDEVNESLAQEMALECGVTLCPLAPKDGPPDNCYDAVLCDWDYWPAEFRNAFLTGLPADLLARPVAVYSYNLMDDQAADLVSQGVSVHGSLQTEVFHSLCEAVIRMRATRAAVNERPWRKEENNSSVQLAGSDW
jgi:hypothetical protein